MTVRSGVLAKGVSTGSGQTSQIGTVPNTDTWVVKSIVLSTLATPIQVTQVYITDASGNFLAMLIYETPPLGARLLGPLFVCVPPGGTLQVLWGSASQQAWVSGAQLVGHL